MSGQSTVSVVGLEFSVGIRVLIEFTIIIVSNWGDISSRNSKETSILINFKVLDIAKKLGS